MEAGAPICGGIAGRALFRGRKTRPVLSSRRDGALFMMLLLGDYASILGALASR